MIPFETLKAYFDEVPIRGKNTELGAFLPSPLPEINFALEQLLATKTIDPSELFFDAGFGDGRVLLLTAAVHGIPSAGAECDAELVKFAEYYIRAIGKLGSARLPITLARGDFRRDETYSGVGIRFKDIPVFYNYANGSRQIAGKIARQSPRGTRFLYRGAHSLRNLGSGYFKGLTWERSIECVHPDGHSINVLHVYRK